MARAIVRGDSSPTYSMEATGSYRTMMKCPAARRLSWAAAACCVGIVLGPTVAKAAAVLGSVFNPTEFTALDSGAGLNLTAGDSLTFNTNSLQITGTIGGAPVSYGGVAASSQGGGVELAVFTFSSVNIGAGTTVNVTGDRGLVFGSQSNFYLGSTIGGLAGQPGLVGTSSPSGGAGGVGAEGGVRGTSYASSPPGINGGNGGNAGVGVAYDGVGYGGGQKAGADQTAGGGGAYGGAGGDAPGSGGGGGVVYGDAALTELYGGSGGGGGRHVNDNQQPHGGGGGGGALELIAAGTMTIDTTLSLAGGVGGGATAMTYFVGGGGGSGGGIILAANQLHFGVSSLVDISGGDGSNVFQAARNSGGGGGGRAAVYANSVTGASSVASRVDLAGGAAWSSATAGADGSLHQTTYGHATFVSPYVRVDFNDMSLGNVHGQAGGLGVTGTWTTPVNTNEPTYHIAAVAGDLVAPASTNFALTQSGTAQTLQGMNNNYTVDKATRVLANPLTDTVWFSFLLEPTSDGRGGINLNGGRIISVGSELRTYLTGSSMSKSNVFSSYGEAHLVLGRLEVDVMASGKDYLQLWINPDVTLGPDNLGTPTLEDLTSDWIGTGGVTSLRIETYAGTAGNATPRIDLITLSNGPTAYLDVTGVPEPSAMMLLTIVTAMLCFRRRRSHAR